ncbi:dihydrodipicolinate synthase family protein [Aquirufa echingensis]|jgi:4-hydroxy-tetrahydrodipicolinate synthase|uniref:Dihydrodipicolinate synthase family protein n=1 Tax=Aquirufa echingensis TaxID=3096516 RepID=A0ABW6CXH6_9BACT
MKLPEGFIPVMLTPFTADLQVDYSCLRKLTEFYLEAGAVGLFANCLSSEMYELSDEERLNVIATVVNQVANRVPVVATGTFGGNINDMAEFSKSVYRLGVDAVIILNNQFVSETESDEVFLARVHAWLDLTPGIPFGIYECPIPYKRLVSIPVLENLLATGRLCYHKDTSLQIDEVAAKIKAGGQQVFGVYDAYIEHAIESLNAGSKGLSCIQGNYFPELVVELCQKTERSQAIQNFMSEHMRLMHETYPISAKYVLQKMGFPIDLATRRKVGELSSEMMKKLDALIEEYCERF